MNKAIPVYKAQETAGSPLHNQHNMKEVQDVATTEPEGSWLAVRETWTPKETVIHGAPAATLPPKISHTLLAHGDLGVWTSALYRYSVCLLLLDVAAPGAVLYCYLLVVVAVASR